MYKKLFLIAVIVPPAHAFYEEITSCCDSNEMRYKIQFELKV